MDGHRRIGQDESVTAPSADDPLLILAMGGIVLVIVLAVMLPIIELNNLVQ